MDAIVNYFKDAVEELHKVRWPTQKQAVRLASIVLAFTVISSLLFGAIDLGLSKGVQLFLSFLF